MKEILRGPLFVYYLVEKLKDKYPDKQIGKTVIQKLMYLFGVNSNEDFDYTMYHYGPYSSEVGEYINMAKALGFLEMRWVPDKGYFTEPLNKPQDLPIEIEREKIEKITETIEKFGKFTANELSIIATAIYVKNNFGVSEPVKIIDTVLSLKPRHQRDWVARLLKEAGVID